jgi:hypothetical protein
MYWEINIFRDRDYIDSVPLGTKKFLLQEKLLTRGDVNISFCGVVFRERNLDVFLPRNSLYEEDITNKIDLAALVLNALKLYSLEFNSPLTIDDGNNDEVIGGTSLSLISELLNDYIQNGIYAKRQTLQTLNSGKPNWNRTIAKSVLYPSRTNSIYLDVIGSKRVYHSVCEIAQIHASIIRDLDEKFSLIMLGKSSVFTDKNIKEPGLLDIDHRIYLLEKELRGTYSSRDMWLLNSLVSYLKDIKSNYSSEFVIGIKHFHTVWEFMLSKTLANTVNVNKLIPVPSYRLANDDLISAPKKGQRMDIVLKHSEENIYCIVDAKYYSASSVNSAPGWPDLVKQFFYAKALKQIEPEARIMNAFIFPNPKRVLKSAHMMDRQEKLLLDDDYSPIECVCIEPMKVLRHFIKRKKLKELTEKLLR